MKLIKAEHKDKGIWYFTTIYKAAEYTNVKSNQIYATHKGKGWIFEEIEDDNVLPQYINPNEPKPEDELKQLISQLEEVLAKFK